MNAVIERSRACRCSTLPILYYPTKREDRATGFLLRRYGASTVRGQSLHNALLLGDRPQPGRHAHYTTGSRKSVRASAANTAITSVAARTATFARYLPRSACDELDALDGGSSQRLPRPARSLRDSAAAPTRLLPRRPSRARTRGLLLEHRRRSQTLQHQHLRHSAATSGLRRQHRRRVEHYSLERDAGSQRVLLSRVGRQQDPAVHPLGQLAACHAHPQRAAAVRFAVLLHGLRRIRGTSCRSVPGIDFETQLPATLDQSLNRASISGRRFAYPFKKWRWLTANSTVSWRDTFYSRILTPPDPATSSRRIVERGREPPVLQRSRLRSCGPVFNRIWDTPGNGYAEKFKHSIEPSLVLQDTTIHPGPDHAWCSSTARTGSSAAAQMTYALTNRFYAKRSWRRASRAGPRGSSAIDLQRDLLQQPGRRAVRPSVSELA